MASVKLSGLPLSVRGRDIKDLMKFIFKKKKTRPAFNLGPIRYMSEIPLKEMDIKFNSIEEASLAQEKLNHYSHFDKSKNKFYILSAHLNIEGGGHSVQNVARPQRPESRKGDSHWEASQHNLEAELRRKKNLLIQEEQRLLLERKRLELIQKFGPSAVEEFNKFDNSLKLPPCRRQEPRPVPKPRPVAKPRPLTKQVSKQKQTKVLPRFDLLCKAIIDQMKPLILEYAKKTDEKILENLITLTLRKRLALALESETEQLSNEDTVLLYRRLYPETTDEPLVKAAARNIEQSHMVKMKTDENVSKTSSVNVDTTNKATTSNSSNLKENFNITTKSVNHKIDVSSKSGKDVYKNEEAKEDNTTTNEIIEIEEDTTESNVVDTIEMAKETNNTVSQLAAEIDLRSPDVSSSVVDDEIKINSDEINNDDMEDWVEGGEGWD